VAELQVALNGAADCAVPATIVLYRSDFTVSELVEPIQGCGTSGGGEVPPPAGCVAELSTFNGDPRFVGVAVSGCGSIKGATFAPTSDEILLAMHTTVDPPCGPVTTAITLANGNVAKIRDDWC
jgi:hypothetical protein